MLPKISKTNTLRRTVALVCAAFAGHGLAAGTLRAQSPVPAPNPSPAVPTPYSSPIFHAGGALTPPSFDLPLPIPFPDPLYGQLQGTPTGLVPGSGANQGTSVSTEIPSFLLGNYLPTSPPTTPGTYFPNHFRDGSAFSWSAPLTFLTPNEVAPATSPTGAILVPTVESTPTAVNATEYPFILNMHYTGTVAGTASTPDPSPRSGTLTATPTTPPTTPIAADGAHLIRQVVYFGRLENISTPTTTASGTTVTNTPVGAIYCVDGFTGEVIWRYQTSSYSDGSVFSSPAVAYINVLVSPAVGTTKAVYANRAVVIVGDNNGFVYCLDATGNGDGTSNSDATTPVTGVPGTTGYPNYIPQPGYGAAAPPAILPAHVGTTSVYWVYRPDPAQPTAAAQRLPGFNASSPLPVPGPFGIASPNIYIQPGVSTTPVVTTNPATNGTLASNAIIYLGNTRDCVYALDGLGVVNNRTATPLPAYNLSLPGVTTQSNNVTIEGTGIPDNVPTCNPRWWFTPDNGANSGISFESAPAISQTGSFLTATIVTSSANQVASGSSVTFKATVVDSSGNGGTPTGTVLFSVDGVAQTAAVPLSGGAAFLTPATPLAAGTHTVTATYSGDATFSSSSNSPAFDEEVQSGTTAAGSIVIASTPANPSTPGQAVTFTATVDDGNGNPAPAGTVMFYIDGTLVPNTGGAASFTTTSPLSPGPHTITATYTGTITAPATSFEQYVYGLLGPVVYIGSSQELGPTSNAGRIYALDGLTGPTYATTPVGPDLSQRPLWAYPNLYATGKGNVYETGPDGQPILGPGNKPILLPVRPALGNITGSPVVFTNTDDVVTPAVGTVGTAGYVPAKYRTRIYFAADSGLEVTSGSTNTTPNPRPASDTTGRVWAIETNGTTAYTTEGANKTVWSFPEANDPNNAAQDFTPEPSPPMGAFLDATPAMGFVQFPATIDYGPSPFTSYTHTDTINTTNVLSKSVPMLYIGTNGTADLGFYGLDVDGSNDGERGVYRLESPTGSSFTSSPVLVTNSSTATAPGNGGAVYATSGNTLLQITATPISNINTAQAFGFVGVDAQFSGGGPISGPSVAAADTHDLQTNTTTTTTVGTVTTTSPSAFTLYGGKNATDFVYFGDGTLGFCRGITPIDPNYGGGIPPVNFGGVTPLNPTQQYSNKFFLQAYLFDGTTDSATDTNMGNALPLNNPISGFEWGGFAYVRIGNVVPPGFDPAAAAPNTKLLVADPTDTTGTTFFGNGQPVNFSVGNSTVTVPTTVLTSLAGTYPNANGFIQRSDPPGTPNSTQLVSPSNQHGWLAAYSYPIGSAQTRIGDTPNAFRRIRQATQTATIYTATKDANGNITGYTVSGTISLIIQTTLGSQYATGGTAATAGTPGTPPTGIAQTPPTEQPTFGILNPLAVQGVGVPLPVNGTQATTAVPVADPNGAGPFGPVSSPTAPTMQDKAAYANGSNYVLRLPNSGYNPATENPTTVLQTLQEQAASASVPIPVATAVDALPGGITGDIPDGSTGDNANGLEVENRSLIGINDRTLFPALPVAMQSVRAHWNDNTLDANGNSQGGPGATVNPLPWEDLASLSTINANTSLDYPDIPASAIAHTLTTSAVPTADLNSRTGSALLDYTTGTLTQPKPVLDSIRVAITPPPHQPANLQVWDSTFKSSLPPIPPGNSALRDAIFPQGYIEGTGSGAGVSIGGGGPQRVFVDIGGHGHFPQNFPYPYRDVQSFAGVPVDMKTEITNGTVSLGNGPSSLGIQTEQYMPPDTYTASSPSGIPALFDPYNQHYQTFFRPLTVLNEGNTNLLNAQFNQQLTYNNSAFPLMAQADANDPLSGFGGFDYNSISGPLAYGQRTYNGSPIPLPNTNASVNEQPFIFLTSLDTDLARAYGVNPGIILNASSDLYPAQTGIPIGSLYRGATFHKPRVGVASTTLTVPDAPDATVGNYSPDYSPDGLPKLPTTINPANNLPYKAVPYVGISVPFGTPVGSYATTDAQPLRLFEGEDTPGANGQFLPPTYKGATGGHAAPASALVTQLLLDANAQPVLPASSGVKLNINVLEDRLTDGFTYGALPMIDSQPAVSNGATPPVYTSTPDFGPAAFRDPATGNLSLYWTSGRTPGSFGIYGVNAPFTLSTSSNVPPGTGYFYPANPAGQWWKSIGGYTAANALKPVLPLSATSPVYSGLTVTEDPVTPANVSAFVVAVSPAAPYSNTLYSYPVTPASNANGTLTPDSFGSAAPITPTSSSSQVKYGVKGLYTGFTNPLWAFWTGSTRGRTALYYNSQASGTWGTTVNLLPVPAGLTAVADASPMLMTTYPGGTQTTAIEVTYSGTAPDGNIDLYVSRYVPAGTTAATASQLNLAAFPPVTENLRASTTTSGWYQARDVAWSRTGALNVSVIYRDSTGALQTPPSLLYDTNNVPQFTKAIYDKASGLLVLTGVKVPIIPASGAVTAYTTNTVYMDSATGRVRFSPALLSTTQNFASVRATFSPQARRLTLDTRADTAPVTFLDTATKANDAAGLPQVEADRRWTIWRKSGVVGSAATLYYKTQRLTAYLPSAVDTTKTITITLNGQSYSGAVDVDNVPAVYNDFVQGQMTTIKYPARAILYFPISSQAEGAALSVKYTPNPSVGSNTTTITDTVQWQDYVNANDPKNFSNTSNPNADPPIDSVSGLDSVVDTEVPLSNTTNENNVAAFLDPFAGVSSTGVPSSHKVWLFWNSTRNGTADIYSETIDPRFAPGP